MIRGIELRVDEPMELRTMLRWAGLVGPWTSSEPRSLKVEEIGRYTVIRFGAMPEGLVAELQSADEVLPDPATLVFRPVISGARTLVFPMFDCSAAPLPEALRRQTRSLVVVRENRRTFAAEGRFQDGVLLLFGVRLSAFVERVHQRRAFDGYGHMIQLLRWWLDHALDQPLVRIDPWPNSRPPAFTSFDVEGEVPRRSVGRQVLRLPPASRPFIGLHRLDLIRPLRGRRIVFSRNRLIDADGVFSSFRCTIDLRSEQRGLSAKRRTVPQYQLHFRLPRAPAVRVTDDPQFHDWLFASFPEATLYYCGGVPQCARLRPEIGFHGTDHTHFHQMSEDDLVSELSAGTEILRAHERPTAIRAPGLLWSPMYYRLLDATPFRIESSHREVNALQPIWPVRTAGGWWELPVHGNLLTTSDPERFVESARDDGTMLNMHCHDHEVKSDRDRTEVIQRRDLMSAGGFDHIGHIGMLDWMERARSHEILALESLGPNRVRVRWRGSPGARLRYCSPDGPPLNAIDGPAGNDPIESVFHLQRPAAVE